MSVITKQEILGVWEGCSDLEHFFLTGGCVKMVQPTDKCNNTDQLQQKSGTKANIRFNLYTISGKNETLWSQKSRSEFTTEELTRNKHERHFRVMKFLKLDCGDVCKTVYTC